MDREIGRVLDQLHAMNADDNTLVLFFSDNGASAEIAMRGDGHDPSAPPGSAATFLSLGPGWSNAANTPFRRHKIWVHEGGIATPLIAHWPAGIPAAGELRHAVGHVIDLAPTILKLAGGTWPKEFDGTKLPPPPGHDLSPTFSQDVDIDRDCLWWLHEGNRAIRQGDWKLVAARDEQWQLYNLANDRAENVDLAAKISGEGQRAWRPLATRSSPNFKSWPEQTHATKPKPQEPSRKEEVEPAACHPEGALATEGSRLSAA